MKVCFLFLLAIGCFIANAYCQQPFKSQRLTVTAECAEYITGTYPDLLQAIGRIIVEEDEEQIAKEEEREDREPGWLATQWDKFKYDLLKLKTPDEKEEEAEGNEEDLDYYTHTFSFKFSRSKASEVKLYIRFSDILEDFTEAHPPMITFKFRDGSKLKLATEHRGRIVQLYFGEMHHNLQSLQKLRSKKLKAVTLETKYLWSGSESVRVKIPREKAKKFRMTIDCIAEGL